MAYGEEVPYQKIEETSDPEKKREYWDAAIGLQKVDGLTPSDELLELKEANIVGKRSYDGVKDALARYYADKDLADPAIMGEYEADLVSLRITRLLDTARFVFSPELLAEIHGQLFKGLFADGADYEGKYRDYDIEKPEPILYAKSVYYFSNKFIGRTLDLAFAEEQANISKYKSPLTIEKLAPLIKFNSTIWQIHPFVEGNTRTTAVFMELYLRFMGYDVDNTQFANYSEYYRNALVRATYFNNKLGIAEDTSYLELFYENLLLGADHKLDQLDLCVHELALGLTV